SHLPIVPNDEGLPPELDDGPEPIATYFPYPNGHIVMHMGYWSDWQSVVNAPDYLLKAFRTNVAHEVGHAIGLGHLPDTQALMYKGAGALDGVTQSDIDAVLALEAQ